MMFAPRLPANPSLTDRFACLIGGLQHVVAAYIAKDRTAGPLIRLLWGRLSRIQQRFARLVERAKAGPLPLPPPRQRTMSPDEVRQPRKPGLPQKFGWVGQLMGYEARASSGWLEKQLADPEMQAFIPAAPQAGRILRPLCHMLGIKPDPKILPPPPKRAKKPEPVQKADAAENTAPPERSFGPVRQEPYRRKPTRSAGPGLEWRKWRGIWMPEPIRK